jgi:hypothetical protein
MDKPYTLIVRLHDQSDTAGTGKVTVAKVGRKIVGLEILGQLRPLIPERKPGSETCIDAGKGRIIVERCAEILRIVDILGRNRW